MTPCSPHPDPGNAYKCRFHRNNPWPGYLCPAHRTEAAIHALVANLDAAHKELADVWTIIQSLRMMPMDVGETHADGKAP